MAPKLKLTYFDLRGRAEVVRLAFVIGDIPFEDNRIKREQWMELKPKTPYLSLPVLEVDGEEVAQSNAMLRYAGKLGRLYPEDALEALRCDEVIDTMQDLFMTLFRYRGSDKAQLKAEREKAMAEDLPRYFGGCEKRVAMWSEGPFVLGDKVSIADLVVAAMFITFDSGILDFVDPAALAAYPRMKKSFEGVMAIPAVVEWYKKHPAPGM